MRNINKKTGNLARKYNDNLRSKAFRSAPEDLKQNGFKGIAITGKTLIVYYDIENTNLLLLSTSNEDIQHKSHYDNRIYLKQKRPLEKNLKRKKRLIVRR